MESNREFKSNLFTGLFNEPDNLRELYNALANTNYGKDTPVKINTIKKVFFKGIKNDVSFTIDDKFVVILEHQSTINNNMPLRCLMYIGRIYEKMISKRSAFKQKLISLPTPEFIVLYNGLVPFPSEKILHLSDAFISKNSHDIFGNLELTVKVININHSFNDELLKKSETLSIYTAFCESVKNEKQKGHTTDEAVDITVKWAETQDVFTEFLEKYGTEVSNMLMAEYNIETHMEVMEEEFQETLAEKDAEIAEKDAEIAELKEKLAKLST
ncbi:MAG: hypothetical protein FWD38_04220 [Oscillospiraceae bacterium]|nr:hypothetical protein [Oscillospiraceae bacterium]